MARNKKLGRLYIICVIVVLALNSVLVSSAIAAPKYLMTIPGTVSVTGKTDVTINVSATYTTSNCDTTQTDQPTRVQIYWQATGSGLWNYNSVELTGASPITYTITGLTCGTGYDIRAVYLDANGVGSCAGPTSGNSTNTVINEVTNACPVLDTTVGSVTSGAQTSSSITITATLTGDSDNDGYCEYYYNTINNYASATLSSSCSNVTGASGGANRTCSITGLSVSTPYYIWAKYIDPDGVTGGPEVAVTGTPISTTAANDTTTGTLTSPGQAETTVDLVAAYTGDANTNNSVTFEWSLAGQSSWNTISDTKTRVGSTWTVTASGLSGSTSYDFRATFSDGDGVTGGPATLNGVSTTAACKSTLSLCTDCHDMPPTDWDGVSAKVGTTGHRGDHDKPAHTGTGTRADCARCHFEYTGMINVTSTARWGFGHADFAMDIFTSNNVSNNVYSAPYDKGIKGGYYKGDGSYILDDNTPTAGVSVCTATYCHGAGDSPVWGTGSAACGSCHSLPPSAGKHSTHSNGYVGYKNNSNSTTYNFGCYKCHDPNAHASGPVSSNQAAPVAFDNLSSPTNPSGSYTAGGSVAGTDGTFNWTNGTCTTTYCHSNGAGSNVTNPTWNGTLAANCTGCHNNNVSSGSPMATNGHTDHINNANSNLARFACIKCHNATVSSDTVIGNEANHVNGVKTVSFDSTNPSGSYDGALNCSNIYCHSSGQATPTYRTPPAWNSATNLTCDGCHGSEGATLALGAPEYANVSTADRNSFNGHHVSSHVSAVTDCVKCHNATVDNTGAIKTSSAHLDTARTVSFLNGGTYSNKRCSSTSCHGSTVLRWGGTASCEDCHFNTGSIGNETDDYTYGNNTTAQINQTEWLTQGHGKTTGTYSWTGNAAANLACTSCHSSAVAHGTGTNPFRLTNPNPDTLCTASCHTTATVKMHNSTNVGVVYPAANATWTFTPKCVDCHDPHGDVAGGVTPAEYNGAMMQRLVARGGSNTYGVPTASGLVNMDFPDDDPATSSDFNYASFQQADFSGLCQVCHDSSDNVINYNKTTNNTSHYSGSNKCTACHPHTDGFGPSGGSCIDCHGTGGSAVGSTNNRRDIQADFGMTSHHINATWANVDAKTCAVCHAEGNYSDGSTNSTYHQNNQVDLKEYTTAPPSGSFNVLTNVTDTNISTHCMGCHNDSWGTTATPFSDSGDNGNPNDYDGSYGSIKARYGDTGTTKSHTYSPATYNVTPNLTKAYSPHGNPGNNQMKNVVSGAWVNDTGQSAINCIDCHNSHGSNALTDDGTNFNGITYTSSVGGTKGGLLKTTSTYDPDETTAYSAGSDLCFDCHLGDDANAPKDYTNFGAANPVHEYFDSGRWTKNTDSVSSNFTYKTGASAFNGGKISGGHIGGVSSTLTKATGGSISGSCMACHDPHGTPTGGYFGTGTTRARMAPALKGTWMSSPYKEDRVASATGADSVNSYGATIGDGAARISPSFVDNNPANVGAGFGTGNSGTFGTYGGGGSGYDGYFIDDNTFGNSNTDSTACNPWGSGTITANYLPNGETVDDFGGLCLGCHTATNLQAVSYSNGTDTIKVHNTVKGWYSAGNAADLFKNTHANQHSMAYYNTAPTASNRCTSAYWTLPAGYRWSVNPGSQKSFTQSGWPGTTGVTTIPPPDNGGQTTSGYKQASFHQFTCSKCHAPHATKLPRLMKTNCLDVGTANFASGGSPRHSSYVFGGACDTGTAGIIDLKMMVCHGMGPSDGGARNISSGGGWNIKTGW